MGSIEDWYDVPDRPSDELSALLPSPLPLTLDPPPAPKVVEFFDDPQPRVDAGRMPLKNGGLPFDVDVMNILAGESGLASKPDAAGIADGVAEGKVFDLRDVLSAVIRRVGGDKGPLGSLILGWLDDEDTRPAWLPDLSGWSDEVPESDFVQGIVDRIVSGLSGTPTTTATLTDLSITTSQTEQRITALEGGGSRLYVPSSTTLDLSAYAMVEVAMWGSASNSGPGSGRNPGTPGVRGGYTWVAFTPDDFDEYAVDMSAVEVVIGTGGASTKFGRFGPGANDFMAATIANASNVGSESGWTSAPGSLPGTGGTGGLGVEAGTYYVGGNEGANGNPGGSTISAPGGAGGIGTRTVAGNGGNGTPSNVDRPGAKSGGSGAGGGAGGGQDSAGVGRAGGNSGIGAFPGGAPGAPGGGGGHAIGSNNYASPGAIATGGNGVMVLRLLGAAA